MCSRWHWFSIRKPQLENLNKMEFINKVSLYFVIIFDDGILIGKACGGKGGCKTKQYSLNEIVYKNVTISCNMSYV